MTDQTTPFRRFLGCDVSKNSISVHDNLTGRTITLANDERTLKAMLAACSPDDTLVVCEPTGGYEAVLLSLCLDLGIPAHRADTLKVRSFIRSFGTLAKTDALDAQGLSAYGKDRCALLTLWTQPDEDRAALQALVRRRAELVALRTAEKNRAGTPKTARTAARAIEKTGKAVLRALDAQIVFLEKKIDDLIEATAALSETIKTMTAVPGIGSRSATTLLALLPELGTLPRKQIVALAGLAPQAKDSGRIAGYRTQHGGRPALKSALFLPALVALRYDPKIKAYYEKKRAEGKPKMVVISAIMAKLIIILNAKIRDFMVKNETADELS